LRLRLGRTFIDEAMNWQPREAGRASIFEVVRILDPRPDEGSLARVRQALDEALPVFQTVPTEQTWAGMIDTTPDAIAVISPVAARPGLFVGTGFSGHGFGIGPAAGELLAALAMDRASAADWQPFRLSRFHDGSRSDIQHWL
jgi:glycine/D-amino acid oxidase-like deaminating enzyme